MPSSVRVVSLGRRIDGLDVAEAGVLEHLVTQELLPLVRSEAFDLLDALQHLGEAHTRPLGHSRRAFLEDATPQDPVDTALEMTSTFRPRGSSSSLTRQP